MKTFSLKVVASDRVFFDGRCKMVILPAMDGQLGVLANHGDMVVGLSMGEMRIQKEDDTWESVLIGTGIMQARHGGEDACRRTASAEAEYSGISSFEGCAGKGIGEVEGESEIEVWISVDFSV